MADCQWPGWKSGSHPAVARISYPDGYTVDLCQMMLDAWLDENDDRGRGRPAIVTYLGEDD